MSTSFKNMEKPKWIRKGIIVIPTQGFGNRMRMLADTWILCKLWNIDMYVIWNADKDCNCSSHEIFHGDMFQWKSMKDLDSVEYTFCGQIHTNDILLTHINNPHKFVEKDYLLLIGGHEFRYPTISMNDHLYLKMHFYQSIKWSHKLTKRITEIRKTLPKEYIGIHYREYHETGDGADANNPNSTIKIFNPARFSDNSPLESYVQFIKQTNIPCIFISNSQTAMQQLRELIPSHASRIKIIPKQSLDRRNVQGILDAIIDFIVLSESKIIIGSFYSSFSDEASCFSLIPKICPLNDKLKDVVRESGSHNYHCYNFSYMHLLNTEFFGLHLNLQAVSNYINLV